ncbi:IS3 family transposase [Nocardia sp. CNY236]|uniref:IS3 family transposase n=1 Tax=Nocardia sp. CNY236 TaxID=1169152 RepID=UPI000400E585|nr:IS3 family transposase [Nocardia sp. CNY236]
MADNPITEAMGSVGDSYDNALMQNFFSTLKTELVYRHTWRTWDRAENALFAYIDGWYNTQGIQKKARRAITRRVRRQLPSPGYRGKQIVRSLDEQGALR